MICSLWIILISSCSTNGPVEIEEANGTDAADSYSTLGSDSFLELTMEQQAAFDALNTLQINVTINHLYSTFPEIDHPIPSPDTSFVLTQGELLDALNLFLDEHCELDELEFKDLAEKAVKAQNDYLVHKSQDTSNEIDYYLQIERDTITSGYWLLPNILEKRDLVLKW